MAIYQIKYKSLTGESFQIITDDNSISKDLQENKPVQLVHFQVKPASSYIKSFSIGFGIDESIFQNLISFVKMPNMEEPSFQENRRKILLIRMGFDKVKEFLDEGIIENKKFILDTQNYPATEISDLWKRCEYLCMEKDIVYCYAPFLDNPPTNFEECEKCQMPEYFAKCKHLKIRWGKSMPVLSGYVRKVFSFECNRGFEFKIQECVNLGKLCFEPDEIKSRRLMELEEIFKKDSFVKILTKKIDKINSLTKCRWGKDLFNMHAHSIWLNFHEPCLNYKDFIIQVNALSNLLDWMNIKEFPIINKLEGEEAKGTLNWLEQFFKETFPQYPVNLIKRLRKIKKIRQRIHTEKDTSEILKVVKEYGEKDINELLIEIKIEFLLSLKELEELFSEERNIIGNKKQ